MKYDASSAIIIKSEKYFIGKRSKFKKQFPGLWETIGGGIEENETPEDCITREIKEELNGEIATMQEYKDWHVNQRIIKLFIITLISEPIPNQNDFDDWGWFSIEELKNLDFAIDCKERILSYDQEKNT